VFIHQFISEEEAVSWWRSFCTARDTIYREPIRKKPTPKNKHQNRSQPIRNEEPGNNASDIPNPSKPILNIKDTKGLSVVPKPLLQRFAEKYSTKIAKLAKLIHFPYKSIYNIFDIPDYNLMKAIEELQNTGQYHPYNKLDISRIHDEIEAWKRMNNESYMAKALEDVIWDLANTDEFLIHAHAYSSSNIENEKINSLKSSVAQELQVNDLQQGLQQLKFYSSMLSRFITQTWQGIIFCERPFGLEPEGNYDINVSVRLLSRLSIKQIRLRQAHHTPPAVGVDFKMNNGLVLQNTLDGNGQFLCGGALKAVFSPPTRLLLHVAAVAHYFDFVTKNQHESVNNEKPEGSHLGENAPCESDKTRTKPIPQRSEPLDNPSDSTPHSKSPNRPRKSCWVGQYLRCLSPGRKPSAKKVLEAARHRINLEGPGYPQVQYTFVSAHVRGDELNLSEDYHQPNYSAVKTFEALLDSIGL
jgi:hypothetical protein